MSIFRYRNKTSPWFTFIIRRVLKLWLWRRYNVTVKMPREISEAEGPFLLVGNHVTFWDPFMIAIPIKPLTRFITSDNIFRTPFFRWAMARFGSIPKTKFVANGDVVRRIVGVIRQKGVIGIFPEARRTWDGRTVRLVPEVPKLVKRLRLPVVAARISGGYLSGPRWSRYRRKGKLIIEYSFAVSPEEAGNLELEQIERQISDAIRYDPAVWQRQVNIPFKGRRLAEYLEQVLFTCPVCRSHADMHSDDDLLTCGACGYTVRYLETGFLDGVSQESIFDTIASWNSWQQKHLEELLTPQDPEQIPRFTDTGARLWTGYMSKPLKLTDRGDLELGNGELLFRSETGTLRRFPLHELEGANLQDREKLEFYWKKELYRIDFEDPGKSTYKWLRIMLHYTNRSSSLDYL